MSDRSDLLLVDLRGTGESGALGCKAFASSTVELRRARRDAARRSSGPDRDLYSTSQAVQDLEAVLRAVGAGKVDLYGDSYGSYAAQAFALRFPERLRSITLDGTYPLPGHRSCGGRPRRGGTARARADLRAKPRLPRARSRRPGRPRHALRRRGSLCPRSRASRPDGDGTRTRVQLNEDALVQIFSSGYYFPALWRELPAAVLAAEGGDTAPILRLGAETVTVDAGGEDPPSFSESLYLAVICHDYPQLWDPDTPIKDRPQEVESPARRVPGRRVHAVHGGGLDRDGLRGLARMPALAVAGARRPARPAGRRLPGRADARPERRPRHDHDLRAGGRRRRSVPGEHVRRGAELHPRDRAVRQGRVRVTDLRALPQDPRRRRHELCEPHPGAAPRPAVPDAGPGRRPGRQRAGRRLHAGRPTARGGARRPPSPMSSRAGGSTTTARASAFAAARGRTRATTRSSSPSTRSSSCRGFRCPGRRAGTWATARSRHAST